MEQPTARTAESSLFTRVHCMTPARLTTIDVTEEHKLFSFPDPTPPTIRKVPRCGMWNETHLFRICAELSNQ